ncbi:MAG: phytanoyl-CoA dioxygenase family protein [Chitinophagales bacterium]
MRNLKQEFQEKGFVVLNRVLDEETIQFYIKKLYEVGTGKIKKSWTIPDGVVANEAFWPVIFNETVLKNVREILGDEAKFLQHNDLHLGYSSFAWHRDGINRSYKADWPDWQENTEPYELMRCGFYLQPEANDFHLGVLPGSHRLSGLISEEEFLTYDQKLSNVENVKAKLGLKDYLKEKAEWIKTKPGDCILFDPRLIHTGGEFEAEKYSFFVAYGNKNRHFDQHYTYYRYLRRDLHYKAIPNTLVEQLKAQKLYAGEEKYRQKIDGAWIPSTAFSFVANFFE